MLISVLVLIVSNVVVKMKKVPKMASMSVVTLYSYSIIFDTFIIKIPINNYKFSVFEFYVLATLTEPFLTNLFLYHCYPLNNFHVQAYKIQTTKKCILQDFILHLSKCVRLVCK